MKNEVQGPNRLVHGAPGRVMRHTVTCAVLLVAFLTGCGGSTSGSSGSGNGSGTGSGSGSGSGTSGSGASAQPMMNGAWAFAGPDTFPTSQPGFAGATFTTSGTTLTGQIYGLSPSLEGNFAAQATLKGTLAATGTVVASGPEIGTTGTPTGQTVTLSGSLTGQSFAGTISLGGGTGTPVSWPVSGYPEPTVAGNWSGIATSSGQEFPLTATLTVSTAASEGANPALAVYAVGGTVTVTNSPCVTTEQIYMLGSQAIGPFLLIDAGALNIEALVNADGSSITGMFSITGGPCYIGVGLSPTGTFTLTPTA